MKTVSDELQKALRRKYHTLASKAGMSEEEKTAILLSYGVGSSRDLSVQELMDVCSRLEMDLYPQLAALDKERKRVLASVGGWYDVRQGKVNRSDAAACKERLCKIKATACRQTGYEHFNDIPLERLRNVYSLFAKKQKDFRRGEEIISEEMKGMLN